MRNTTAWLAIGAMMVLSFAGCRGGSSGGGLASRMWPWGGAGKAPQTSLASNGAPNSNVAGPPLPSQNTTPNTLNRNSPFIAGNPPAPGAPGAAAQRQTQPASYAQTQSQYSTNALPAGYQQENPYSSYGVPAKTAAGYAQTERASWTPGTQTGVTPAGPGYPSTTPGYAGAAAATTNPYAATNVNPGGPTSTPGYGANSPYREPVQSFAGGAQAGYQNTAAPAANADPGSRYNTAALPTQGDNRYPNYGQPAPGAGSSNADPTMPPLGQTGYSPGNMSDNKPYGAGAYQTPYPTANRAVESQQPSPYLPGSTGRFTPGDTPPAGSAPQSLAAPQPSSLYR